VKNLCIKIDFLGPAARRRRRPKLTEAPPPNYVSLYSSTLSAT